MTRPFVTGILKPATVKARANRSLGLCQCGKTPMPGKGYCEACKRAIMRSQGKLKETVIAMYGGKCQCPSGLCHESAIEFLNIDHKYNNGSAHRKAHKMSTYRFYTWLRDQPGPLEQFQVLCCNCNFGKVANRIERGVCPHVTQLRKQTKTSEAK